MVGEWEDEKLKAVVVVVTFLGLLTFPGSWRSSNEGYLSCSDILVAAQVPIDNAVSFWERRPPPSELEPLTPGLFLVEQFITKRTALPSLEELSTY